MKYVIAARLAASPIVAKCDIDAERPSPFVVSVGGQEMLRIEPNGDFFVRGKLTATDAEVYEVFKEWMGATDPLLPLKNDAPSPVRIKAPFESPVMFAWVPSSDEAVELETLVRISKLPRALAQRICRVFGLPPHGH